MLQMPPILDFNDQTNKGTLFDTRDGQSYPVVKIGNQIWLAENFRYLPSKEKGDPYENSWVYKNNNDYLDLHYGRLYDFNTAMNIAPEGWRLPSNEDFIELIDFIKKDNNLAIAFIIKDNNLALGKDNQVGSYLKSVNCWKKSINILKSDNDKYGFNAKPVGYHSNYGYFYGAGDCAYFWSATKYNKGYIGSRGLLSDGEDFNNNRSNKDNGLSVRLIKDS